MDLISVIVPVYNVSGYLCECVDSVLAQTYENLEIILVDDGSTDGCAELCDNYALKDGRVKAIHQTNEGLSAARNNGYAASNGKYIAFIDADDTVFCTYIERLHSLVTTRDAQIAVCNYTRDSSELGTGAAEYTYTLTSEQMLRQWHGKRKSIETVAWNKLYSRGILENFKDCKVFPEGKNHEDIYTSHLLVDCAKIIAITGEKLYFYRRRENSISRTFTKEAAQADLDAQRVRLGYFKGKKFYRAYMRLLVGHLLHKGMYVVGRNSHLSWEK